MLLAAGHSWRPDRGLTRWAGALIATIALHGGALAAGLVGWQSVVPPTPPAAAIMLELAPLPVSPAAAQTQSLPQSSSAEPRLPTPQPTPIAEPEAETAPARQLAAALPLPAIDPVPPAVREPEVVMPEPAPERPKVAPVAEKPKAKPKPQASPEQPKVKPVEKPKQTAQPKPEAAPDTQDEPAVTQTSAPQPAQQAAPAAAPVQQASVAAAPSAADVARRATAEANWQGLLLAHLEKHKSYPKSARRRHEQGTGLLRFRMDRSGRVLSFALARSSGFDSLDSEVLAMIERAQPLPALPAEMSEAVVEIVVPVQFALR